MIREVPLGVYVPGTTLLHRASPAAKFLALIVFIVAVTILPSQPWHTAAALAAVMFLYGLARIPWRIALRQFAPVLPLLLILGLYLWWQNGAHSAATTTLGLVATLAAANLFTLTTGMEELLEALEKTLAPLDRVGVPVETISLAIALTIRLIPLMFATVGEVLDARKARGAGFSLAAFGTPVVIRSIKRARDIGEALMARGAAD
ncbi:energy-coupling factor transporter transmembrane component T family protein [Corynebacterium timonense]|uniref:Energy-coupling factor transporter transmembrane protein EcfT n=1 Tax=Corynebacterium timonense TaxID=441500 RepID=A0A1H1N7D7_9CORY|nr:energy-coupling factor transporter transmembrane protein EcfT [Corynebacterium timonense]SDR94884.1 Energy-coupling factor transporter transmembrane protein EcfT [Corynebacterium timonense]